MAKKNDNYLIGMVTSGDMFMIQRASLTFKESRIIFDVLREAMHAGYLKTFYMETEDHRPMDFKTTFDSFRPLALTQFWPEELRPD